MLLWGNDRDVSDAITKLGQRITEAREDSRAHFRLGVAYRQRYDSDERRAGDFQKAVEQWVRALELDPNQYIFRRRIQQYGPRLDKPYPFYDWVPEARAAVEARGETPVTLRVEPGGAEFAEPLKSFAASADTGQSPDPDGRIYRDEKPLIVAESVVVPTVIERGESARIHVTLRPDLSLKAHWNNEVDDLVFWVDPPEGFRVDRRYHTVAIPPEPVSQELRQVEFEIASPENFTGTATLPAYALYYVCEDIDGTCLFRRQDVHVELSVNRLHVGTKDALRKLVRDARLTREKVAGQFLYCATNSRRRRQQLLARRSLLAEPGVAGAIPEAGILPDELRAAIVLFFSLLDEKQRRLYAGLEALKTGRGGDGRIAEFLGLDAGTVARGRQELVEQDVEVERARRAGGGRKPVEKKHPRSSRTSKS